MIKIHIYDFCREKQQRSWPRKYGGTLRQTVEPALDVVVPGAHEGHAVLPAVIDTFPLGQRAHVVAADGKAE